MKTEPEYLFSLVSKALGSLYTSKTVLGYKTIPEYKTILAYRTAVEYMKILAYKSKLEYMMAPEYMFSLV